MKHNKTNKRINTYPSLNKDIDNLDPKENSNLNKRNNWTLRSNKDLKNLSNKNNSILDNRIIYDTLHQQDQKNLVAQNCKKTQSEITAKLSDPKLSGVFLNSVNSSFKIEKEGRVTAVVAKARYQEATKNQAEQRFEHSARSRPSNTVIKVLLDSGSDDDLMFHKKEHPCISPT